MSAEAPPRPPREDASEGTPPAALRAVGSRLARAPNPIWMREMRQSARLARTPWILFALTLTLSLLMCAIGGLTAAAGTSPAEIGGVLFQVFFSIAYLVVVVAGPAIAANSIASEREGRTWEAVLLTGLDAKRIARGKFLAAFTSIALYIVVLAPVGALSFLFGGVTATEVVVAFAFLFLIAALAVAFGLAVSSLMTSLRGAIVVTLMLAIGIGPMLYFVLGFGASLAINRQWSAVPAAFPVWLPLAYERAPFGVAYVALLVVLPTLLCAVPGWFLYEVTIANLSADADDRSTGLKRWFTVSTPLLAAAAAMPIALAGDDDARVVWTFVGLAVFGAHAVFCALLFAFEPAGPSRRVRVHWARARAGAWRRFFGPGLLQGAVLVTALGALGMAAIAGAGIAVLHVAGGASRSGAYVAEIFVVASYVIPFFVFVVGLGAWLRARGGSPWAARLVTSGILLFVAAAPWVAAAIAGVIAQGSEKDWLAIASPSPFYVLAMVAAIGSGTSDGGVLVPAGLVCGVGWGVTGLILLGVATQRARRTIAERDAELAATDLALRAEAEAAVRAGETPAASSLGV